MPACSQKIATTNSLLSHMNLIQNKVISFETICRAMPQAVSRPDLTAKAWVRFLTSQREICGGRSDTGTDFCPRTSVFACVSIGPPMCHNLINLNASLTIRAKEKRLGTLKIT